MKKILFLMSIAGIFFNPLFGSALFEQTPTAGDTYTLQQTFTKLEEARSYLESQASFDPASYSRVMTNLGSSWVIDYAAVENMTNATGLGYGTGYYLLRENNATNPVSFVLDTIAEGPMHEGPPQAFHVHAIQLPGTKDVQIDCFVALGSDAAGGGDKPTTVEFWFKGNPSSIQWDQLFTFESLGSYQTPGAIQAGSMTAIWKAGNEIPNYKTLSGKIRVLLAYDRDEAGMTVTGSGWDGYEAENGPTFIRNNANPMISHNDQTSFFNMLFDNDIQRIGSYQTTSDLLPVYELTGQMLQDLTGTSGIPDGKYAYGEEEDPNFPGTTSRYIIPVTQASTTGN